MWKHNDQNLGEFQEVDHARWFTYRLTTNDWALKHGLPHEVDVFDGVRYAKVLKTVVHVAVDERADGTPVLQRWFLRTHRQYNRTGA